MGRGLKADRIRCEGSCSRTAVRVNRRSSGKTGISPEGRAARFFTHAWNFIQAGVPSRLSSLLSVRIPRSRLFIHPKQLLPLLELASTLRAIISFLTGLMYDIFALFEREEDGQERERYSLPSPLKAR